MNFSGLFSLCLTLSITQCNTLAIRDTPFENVYDVDPGDFRDDIPKINLESPRFLFQGDIVQSLERNALKDPTSRWKFPIPYILADNLDLNAKGEILNSFEQYRLKSCVDFKPYDGEETYIIFQKLDGCWSSVGDLHSGQTVSIGERCDYKAIVEHELLHALGFYHEQSRTDRDDYVNIWWDEIIPGMEHNFVVYDDNYITDLNTPYDYESLMHYAPFSFNKNDSFPTITAKIPAFDEIIGQRLDFSAIDLLRLNRMYNCSSTLTLLDQCSFEFINICGMIQGENEDVDWVHMKSNPGNEDHTVNGKCRDSGYFMYFDAQSGKIGQTALLESRILYPKRTEQCLQFFYKMTGSLKDKLVIWLKMDDGTGTVRKLVKIKTFQADGSHDWNIAHVTLHAKVKFRYLFQGIIGDTTNSAGGIFLDDITLTETRCPQTVWHIKNFSAILQNTGINDTLKSPRFYNTEGYGYGLILHPHSRYENYMGLFFQLCSGENDGILEWPVGNRQAMVTVMDQDPDVKLRMSSSRSFTTNGSKVITDRNDTFFWDRPTLTGTYDSICDCYRSIGWGWSAFISHKQLQRRNFLKNDDLIIFVEFNDLTPLINSEVPIHPPSSPERHRRAVDYADYVQKPQSPLRDLCHPEYCLNGGVCITTKGKASCRCGSTQARLYFGERCEKTQIHGSLFGIMIGGTAGVIALAVAVISMIAKTRINGKHPIGSLFDS